MHGQRNFFSSNFTIYSIFSVFAEHFKVIKSAYLF
jgi:hypothetical protein